MGVRFLRMLAFVACCCAAVGERCRAGEMIVGPDQRAYWAFQKLNHVDVPQVKAKDKVRTPADAFVLAKLEAKGLSFAPEASRAVLCRRAYFDLTGLPPSPEDVAKFVDDPAPDAYEQLIARLLASPHFGERWGRHWLDAAGYVDTVNDDTDAGLGAVQSKYLYRDYVVRAFNEDKPFDRFVVEQLAGDELVDWRRAPASTPQIKDLLIATGFLRTAPDKTNERELNTPDIRHAILGQQAEVMVNCMLALTFNCARCHSHKYDPIPQEDYYRLLAVFTPLYNVEKWITPGERDLPEVSPAEQAAIDKANGQITAGVESHKKQIDDIERPVREQIRSKRLESVPGEIRDDVRKALEAPDDKRDAVQKYLAGKFGQLHQVKPEETDTAMSAEQRETVKRIRDEISQLESHRRGYGRLASAYDTGPAPQTHLLLRGNYATPGAVVPPAYPRVLCDSDAETSISDMPPFDGTSGRRLALARWLTNPRGRAGALAARVYVNRVWQHLFGKGIVATTGNFGHSGTPPTHPELLEWLAGNFVANDYRLKPLLMQIMTSSAYRQTSIADAAESAKGESADPGNELLWHMPLRQVESEVVRDSILAVSGKLQQDIGGPPVMTEARSDGFVMVRPDNADRQFRRSLYLLARRRYHLSLLEAFGQPEVSTNCPERRSTVVVSQSLTMMNDAFLFAQAEEFAKRVEHETPNSDAPARIDRAFKLALSRGPSDEERTWANELLDRQSKRFAGPDAPRKSLAHLCHMLLSTNEFLYVQ